MGDEALFGRWLQKRRKSLGLTQSGLAERAQCSVAMLRKIESEERRPSARLAHRLAASIDVPAEEREAFANFARGGWSDRPPRASRPMEARPWLHMTERLPGPGGMPLENGAPSPPPLALVAREAEMERLESGLDQALANQAQVVLIHGEAGQGKTALLQAFAHSARGTHPDILVAWGSCNAYSGRGDPYLPFRNILQHLLGDVSAEPAGGTFARAPSDTLERDPDVATAVAELAPDLVTAFLAAPPPAASEPPPMQRIALMAQYTALVGRIAKARPLLLILDDLQWIDSASADLLLHLGKHLAGTRVLLLGSYRKTEVAVGREGGRHPLASPINELRREFGEIMLDLDRRDDRAFLDGWLDQEPNTFDEAFREALFRQTGGHPLFVVELLRAMRERGELARDEQGAWTAPSEVRWHALPARIEGVIDERVGRLSRRLEEWLRVAAVEGEEFSAEVISHVLGVPVREVVRGLSIELSGMHQLVAAQEVWRMHGSGISRFRFRHHLIQRRVYEQLDAVEKAHLHEAVADALGALYAHRIDEAAVPLAHHYVAAGAVEQARDHLRQAGRNARRTGAHEEAIRYFQMALENRPGPASAEEAATERELAECQWVNGQLVAAQTTLARAARAYESLGDAEGTGAVQRLIGRVYWEMGMRAESLDHYTRSLNILQDHPDTRELAWTLSSMSQMHMLANEYDEAMSWGERALELASRLDAKDVVAHALANIGTALLLAWPERAGEGEAKLVESRSLALELGMSHDACRATFNLAEALRAHGRADEARHLLNEGLPFADRLGMSLYSHASRSELFDLERSHGRWREAFENPAWSARRDHGSDAIGHARALRTIYIATAHTDLGEPETALRCLESASPIVASQNELQVTLPYLGERIRALAALDRSKEVAEEIERLLNVLAAASYTKHNGCAALLAACAWLGAGNGGRPHELLQACLAEVQRLERQFASPNMAAAVREAEGWWAMLAERLTESAEHLEDAAAQWRELGLPLDRLRALHGVVAAFHRLNRPSQARRAFDAGDAILGTLEAEVEIRYVRARLASVRRERMSRWSRP